MQIEDYIGEQLPLPDQEIALGFTAFLRENQMEVEQDKGYWKEKIYYHVKYNGICVCFIAINDPDERENRWTVWSDDMDFAGANVFPIEDEIKETTWNYVNFCGSCGCCGGGRRKVVFGKAFDNVCGCTFRVDNPDADALQFLKTIIDIRKNEILRPSK